MSEAFQKLQEDFPVFTIQNRTSIARELTLANGESVHLGPDGTANVQSALIYQIPDIRYFVLKNPSTEVLVAYGLLERFESGTPVVDSTAETTAPVVDTEVPTETSQGSDFDEPDLGPEHPSSPHYPSNVQTAE